MGRLIAIDPGKRAGLAVFDADRLIGAARFDGDKGPALYSHPAPIDLGHASARLVVEVPCDEKGPRKGRASMSVEDLIALSFRAGFAAGRAHDTEVPQKVNPQTWKGQQSKEACHAKARKLLSADEAAIFDRCGPDERDAIALGLWALNR